MRTWRLNVGAFCLACLAGTTAVAENPCLNDVKQFCAEIKPGGGRVEMCLQQNKEKVTPACSERLQALEKQKEAVLEEFTAACEVDVGRLCSEVKPGGGRKLACLLRHQDDLSSSCQAEMEHLEAAKETVQTAQAACTADAKRICPDVTSVAGLLVECLQEHEDAVSAECRSVDLGTAAKAAQLVDAITEMGSREQVMQTLEILQGLNSVAFTRNQIALQVDNYQSFAGVTAANGFTFNPQFVFGHRNEFAIIARFPILMLYPYTTAIPTTAGPADITTAFAWGFYAKGQIRQFLALGLQWKTGTPTLVGAPWALGPTYAIAVGLARWVSLTTEINWVRSFGPLGNYPEWNYMTLRPILAVSLPASSFVALDTKLHWNFVNGTFVPVMKAVAGKFIDRGKSLSISAWYQVTLTSQSVWQTFPFCFNFGVGGALNYYFDW